MALPKIEVIVAAYHRLDGNKTAVAEELGIDRNTVRKYLKEAGVDKPLHSGRLEDLDPVVMPLPAKNKIARYILTSAQNNTKVHGRFWENLTTYAEFLDAQLMVSRFTYNKSAYHSAKSVKPGRGPTTEDLSDLWYDPRILPFVCDDPSTDKSCQYQLAPDLLWCAEMNILPTASRPLSELDSYTKQSSGIFPHAKLAMEPVATAKGEPPKHNYTTGTVTHRNYIQKKAGLKAEFHHAYSALIVEVNSSGEWWLRQLNADSRGTFYDCPRGVAGGGALKIEDGEVIGGCQAEGINWGDVHASEIDPVVAEANWGKGGIIDELQPRFQFMHDVFSMRSRSHHDVKSYSKMLRKYLTNTDKVEDEVKETTALMRKAARAGTTMVVVCSNHDRHLDRWMDETDFRKDPPNARFYLEAQLAHTLAAEKGEPWVALPWALTRFNAPAARYLKQDESFILCPDKGGGIECGWHGDDGPNGTRGSTRAYVKAGRRVNKGHDHSAAIMDGVYSAGACAQSFDYQHGPSTHSVSHIVTWPNGKRTLVTLRAGRWRA